MKPLHLQDLLIPFFQEHLQQQRQVSRHTLLAYRDTFQLLLDFLQRAYRVWPSTLQLEALTPERVLAFLAHLEQRRGNRVRSRNARLAAIDLDFDFNGIRRGLHGCETRQLGFQRRERHVGKGHRQRVPGRQFQTGQHRHIRRIYQNGIGSRHRPGRRKRGFRPLVNELL